MERPLRVCTSSPPVVNPFDARTDGRLGKLSTVVRSANQEITGGGGTHGISGCSQLKSTLTEEDGQQ